MYVFENSMWQILRKLFCQLNMANGKCTQNCWVRVTLAIGAYRYVLGLPLFPPFLGARCRGCHSCKRQKERPTQRTRQAGPAPLPQSITSRCGCADADAAAANFCHPQGIHQKLPNSFRWKLCSWASHFLRSYTSRLNYILPCPFLPITIFYLYMYSISYMGTYLVQTKDLVQTHANLLIKVSKISEKNHEYAYQLTSSIYKILWSNSSYSKSYKKDKFSDNNNGSNASQICLFCNF